MTEVADRHSSVRAPSAVFEPVATHGRATLVARRISDAIGLGLLVDGERLPSEPQLAGALGVSIATVRDALTILRERELLRTQRGRGGGSFVQAPGEIAVAVLEARLLGTALVDLRDLCDHYGAVAGMAAKLAGERAADDDVGLLRGAIDELEAAGSLAARYRAAARCPVEVAAAAQSAQLTGAVIALQTEVGPLVGLAYRDDDGHREAVRRQRAIADAIADADGERARTTTEEHAGELYRRARDLHRELRSRR